MLQKITWSENVATASQRDDFRPVVENLLRQCATLHRFHLGSGEGPVYEREGDAHLLRRAASRNENFQPNQHHPKGISAHDNHYQARDSILSSGSKSASEAAFLVWRWSRNISVTPDLAARLQEWPSIQGYIRNFEVHLLSSLINFEPAANWGSLFKVCQLVQGEYDKPKLMFMFAAMAFGGQIDMVLIKSLIAIAIMDESLDLQLPQCAEFIRFRGNQVPTDEHLVQYIRPHRTPYPEDERTLLSVTMHSKQRRRLELAQRKFEEVGPS